MTEEYLRKLSEFYGLSVDTLLGIEDKSQMVAAEDGVEYDAAFFRVIKEAKENGVSPKDLEKAMKFIREARNEVD